MSQNRKPTPSERAKILLVQRQLAALDAEAYRITCMHETEPSFNLGKGKGPAGKEKFYTAEEVKQKVGLLSAKNVNGYNIYITPIDSKRHYMLIDDLDIDKARRFWDWGYRPSLVQKSSAESIQAISILPKSYVSHGAANALFKKLNRHIGDPKISGLVHPFRLAGFANKKPSRRVDGKSPFVSLVHTRLIVDEKATLEARSIDDEVKADARQARAPRVPGVAVTREAAGDCDVAAARSWYQRRMDFWDDQADLSRIDRQLARRLRGQGYSESAAQAVVRAVSPHLETRHPRIDDYLHGKTADLYPLGAEQKLETAPKATTSAGPKPR